MSRALNRRYGHMAPMWNESGFRYWFVAADCGEQDICVRPVSADAHTSRMGEVLWATVIG
jgi:hypothetical protein